MVMPKSLPKSGLVWVMLILLLASPTVSCGSPALSEFIYLDHAYIAVSCV